jgi:chromosome segregation ATPase
VNEANLLTTLREAANLESKRMEELHKIDVVTSSIEQLVADYERKRQEIETAQQRGEAAWNIQQATREREQKEYDENLKKQRQRERDEYEYQKSLDRKREQDAYEQKSATLERSLKEKREVLEKNWKERESQLSAAEAELERLRKESAELPERLKREIAKAVTEAVKATEQKAAQEMNLTRKEMEADRRVSELRVQTLDAALTRQHAEAEALQRKLDEATRQVQEVAIKTIEGASGAQALQHVNKIAMEQAKKPQS